MKHDLPGVGKNFHDQPALFGGMTFFANKGMGGVTIFDAFNPLSFLRYKYDQTGIYFYFFILLLDIYIGGLTNESHYRVF